MFSYMHNLWIYRGFIASSIRNEFFARFSRSKLGGLWMIINPLAQVLIYALILSNVLAAKLPGIDNTYAYSLYLMAGIAGWSLFSEVVSRCLNLFIENGNLMKKMRFPRITMPTITVGSCLLNYSLLLVSVLAVFSVLGHVPGIELLWILPITLVNVTLALGIGLILGVINVFVRDVGQIVPILIQTLFWFTPIVYPLEIVPETIKAVIAYNPMIPIVSAYHDILVFGKTPAWQALSTNFLVSAALLIIGLFMFRRASAEMVDVL